MLLHDSCLFSWSEFTWDEMILLESHSHTVHVKLFLICYDTFCRGDNLLVPLWIGVPSSDNVLLIIQSLFSDCSIQLQYFISNFSSMLLQEALCMPLSIHGLPIIPDVFYSYSPWWHPQQLSQMPQANSCPVNGCSDLVLPDDGQFPSTLMLQELISVDCFKNIEIQDVLALLLQTCAAYNLTFARLAS